MFRWTFHLAIIGRPQAASSGVHALSDPEGVRYLLQESSVVPPSTSSELVIAAG